MAFEKIVILDAPEKDVTLKVTQTDIVGLHSLQSWLQGFSRAKGEEIPGGYEMVMFYRRVVEACAKPKDAEKDAEKEDEKCSGSSSEPLQQSPQ